MRRTIPKNYSRYVSLMKIVLPVGILLSVGFAFGWPYLLSLGKEEIVLVDTSQPEIKENRMVRPHYLSTDSKGQPFHVNADWAKEQSDNLANLVNPEGSMTMGDGQTFNVKAKEGRYNKETKVLNLKGGVKLTSTAGYLVTTEQANVTIDDKTIEGNSYIEGEGPTGKIKGAKGFKIVDSGDNGKKIITLKGHSQVVIKASGMKKHKKKQGHSDEQ
ncbi:MAG TPA: LPS export ABC transporter periplasmic protein LptC [Alphaproteobacteria bacterium]|nr:LPS export ABC transporter periplasmic protein LptC [Alphaproteobacteria bacterium]